ncbi:hypothetical protein LINPERHAP2_LOCUS38584 [Linum perenne]|jgi:hypothetical protein
MQRI